MNGSRNEVTVLDASSARVRQVLTGFDSPDALSFSDRFAYVRSTGSPRISLAGVYSTTVRVKEPGTYDVAFLLDSPRVVACVEQRVEDSGRKQAERAHRVEVEPRFDASVRLKAGDEHALRFKVVDAGSDKPVSAEEISVLLFRGPGSWQWRGGPRAVGQGEFEVTFRPPSPGEFKFLVGVQSRGAPLGSFRPITLGVVDGASPAAASRVTQGVNP